jgi:hypothetical protein
VKEAPDRAEYRRETFEAVCYLGEEVFEDFILCEEVDRDCVKGGLCGENGKWWNFVWKDKIVHTRQGLVADRAWDNKTAVHLSFIRLTINRGQVEFQTRRWSKSTKREQAEYELIQEQIHLAVLDVIRTANQYIRNWHFATPKVLTKVHKVCPCPDFLALPDEQEEQ